MRGLNLDTFSDAELLQKPISSLVRGKVAPFIRYYRAKLIQELKNKNILITPRVYCSTDWFCPDGEAGFAFPFYLVDERLKEVYLQYFYDLDGTNEDEIMRLFRHEMAHVIDNVFGLRRLKKRQQIFGLTSKKYPRTYRPNLKCRDFVTNLGEGYGQSHPDEDWAETFSIWLSGEDLKNCSKIAKEKYNYLSQVMAEKVVSIRPRKKTISFLENIFGMDLSYEEFLRERKKDYQKEFGVLLLNHFDYSELICREKRELKNFGLPKIIARNLFNCSDHFKQATLNPTSLLEKRNFSLSKLDRIMM